jgi:nuclear control of ATPase protein 2
VVVPEFVLITAFPCRVANVLSSFVQHTRTRLLQTRSLRAGDFSFRSLGRAITAFPPSLLLTSLFPHLSSAGKAVFSLSSGEPSRERLLVLTFAPIHLTRLEARTKRKALQKSRDDLALRIGRVAASGVGHLEIAEEGGGGLDELGKQMGRMVGLLEYALESDVSDGEPDPDGVGWCIPRSPRELADCLSHLLQSTVASHVSRTQAIILANSRPGLLTRAWPVMVSLPIATYLSVKSVYTKRFTIKRSVEVARDTVRGFFINWVLEPAVKILETVRHGEGESLAIMGRQSLASDFDVPFLSFFIFQIAGVDWHD